MRDNLLKAFQRKREAEARAALALTTTAAASAPINVRPPNLLSSSSATSSATSSSTSSYFTPAPSAPVQGRREKLTLSLVLADRDRVNIQETDVDPPRTPYSHPLLLILRTLKGVWDPSARVWSIALRDYAVFVQKVKTSVELEVTLSELPSWIKSVFSNGFQGPMPPQTPASRRSHLRRPRSPPTPLPTSEGRRFHCHRQERLSSSR